MYFILLCMILSGCAGMADYTISLDNGFSIERLSVHQIAIYGDEPVQYNDTSANHLYVPAKVTDVWWNKEYIVAKQIALVADENGYERPPKKPSNHDYSYWLINVDNNRVLGPLDKSELDDETNKLGITEKLSLIPIEKLIKNGPYN